MPPTIDIWHFWSTCNKKEGYGGCCVGWTFNTFSLDAEDHSPASDNTYNWLFISAFSMAMNFSQPLNNPLFLFHHQCSIKFVTSTTACSYSISHALHSPPDPLSFPMKEVNYCHSQVIVLSLVSVAWCTLVGMIRSEPERKILTQCIFLAIICYRRWINVTK